MSQDHLSTLSRPRSTTEAYVSNGSIPNGRTIMANGNGNAVHSNGNGYCNGLVTRTAGGLHEDLEFPQVPRTLTRKKGIVWMRPHVSIPIHSKFQVFETKLVRLSLGPD
jgi:hypothetical protein